MRDRTAHSKLTVVSAVLSLGVATHAGYAADFAGSPDPLGATRATVPAEPSAPAALVRKLVKARIAENAD